MLSKNIQDNLSVAISLEFNSPIDRKKLANNIASITNRDVQYSNRFVYHPITESSLFLTRNDVGGKRMSKIQIPLMPYAESVNTMLECLDVIGKYGFSTGKCNVRLQLSINSDKLDIPHISKINRIKLNSAIDECLSLATWYKAPYADSYINSLSYIMPNSLSVCEGVNPLTVLQHYTVKTSKKSIVDTNRLNEGIVSVKCNMGKDYEKNKQSVLSYLDNLSTSVYNVLRQNEAYTLTEQAKLNQVLRRHTDITKAIKSYKSFETSFGVAINFDEKSNVDMINTIYDKEIKLKLFELLAFTDINLKECKLNYCVSRKRLQIANGIVKCGFLVEGIDFARCYLSGEFSGCNFGYCDMRDSIVENCELFEGNIIESSTINEVAFHGVGNKVINSFITNSPELLVEADLYRCVVKGPVGYSSRADDYTEILD